MKIEVKSKENQRLSMHNEQLQFRLQSTTSASLNATCNSNINDSLFNSPNVSLVAEEAAAASSSDLQPIKTDAGYFEIRTRNQKTKLTRAATLSSQSYELDIKPDTTDTTKKESTTSAETCRLRSKSLKGQVDLGGAQKKAQLSTRSDKLFSSFHQAATSSSSSFGQQFRPVSEHFDFNINDRDVYMTRSVNVYERSSSVSHQEANEAAFLAQFENVYYDSMIESGEAQSRLNAPSAADLSNLNGGDTHNESADANDATKLDEEEECSEESSSSCVSISNQSNVNNQSVVFVE
jgi:hypothetical protein